jgi:hypothetical protein
MQDVSQVSGALNDRGVRRWMIAVAATATFMIAGGYLGSVGFAQAAGDPGTDDVGSSSLDGLSVTCYAYTMPLRDDALICNVVGDGEDGAPGSVYRLVAPPTVTPPVGIAPDQTR